MGARLVQPRLRSQGRMYFRASRSNRPTHRWPRNAPARGGEETTMDDQMTAAAQVVRLALTPVFLLTAVGTILNVFATRLGRISDRVHAAAKADPPDLRRLDALRVHSRLLDLAVLSIAVSGVATCCAAMTLFLGTLRIKGQHVLFAFFGAALIFAIAGLCLFVTEVLLAGRLIRDGEL